MFSNIIRLFVLMVLTTGITLAAIPGPVYAEGCADLTPEMPITDACLAEMAAAPEPGGLPLEVNSRALAQYTFMRIRNSDDATQPVTIYDAPNGNPISTLDPGFNFVTVLNQVEDWVEINAGEWVRATDVQAQLPSRFAGVLITEPLARPFAWILVNTYTAEVPGGPQIIDPARLHLRYERVNVYATVNVDGHNWYLIAPNEWVYHTWVAIVSNVATPRPEGVSGKWVAVDLYEQTLVAYQDDTMVFATLVSSGLPDWSTNEGLFNIWARFSNDYMSGAEGASDFYYLENVPYVMYFDGEISLHGTYWHDGFGYRHSHGCVNLSITDAHWLFNWTSDEPSREAAVYVFYSGEY